MFIENKIMFEYLCAQVDIEHSVQNESTKRPMPSCCFLNKDNFYHKVKIVLLQITKPSRGLFGRIFANHANSNIVILFFKSIHFCICI